MSGYLCGLVIVDTRQSNYGRSTGGKLAGCIVTQDAHTYGSGVISGHVRAGGLPVSRKLYLLDARTKLVLRQIWSGIDGSYAFEHIDTGSVVNGAGTREYLILAEDYTNTYRDEAINRVFPVVV